MLDGNIWDAADVQYPDEILPPEACTLAGLALAAGQFAPLTR